MESVCKATGDHGSLFHQRCNPEQLAHFLCISDSSLQRGSDSHPSGWVLIKCGRINDTVEEQVGRVGAEMQQQKRQGEVGAAAVASGCREGGKDLT